MIWYKELKTYGSLHAHKNVRSDLISHIECGKQVKDHMPLSLVCLKTKNKKPNE